MTKKLNGLQGVLPWDFTAMAVLERKLEYKLLRTTTQEEPEGEEEQPAEEQPGEEHNENGSQTPSTQDDGQESQIPEAENGQAVAEDEGAPSPAKFSEAESGATSATDEGQS
jgi:hypothetical protein